MKNLSELFLSGLLTAGGEQWSPSPVLCNHLLIYITPRSDTCVSTVSPTLLILIPPRVHYGDMYVCMSILLLQDLFIPTVPVLRWIYHSCSRRLKRFFYTFLTFIYLSTFLFLTRHQAVARIADRTAKNCRGHVTFTTFTPITYHCFYISLQT